MHSFFIMRNANQLLFEVVTDEPTFVSLSFLWS
jgi:hypothetical protein